MDEEKKDLVEEFKYDWAKIAHVVGGFCGRFYFGAVLGAIMPIQAFSNIAAKSAGAVGKYLISGAVGDVAAKEAEAIAERMQSTVNYAKESWKKINNTSDSSEAEEKKD